MSVAEARHILVGSESEARALRERIDAGEDFSELARAHSTCPSGRDGGSLGSFGKGQMVQEFEDVVFGELPVGEVSPPVKTAFGFHLIVVDRRMD